VEGKEYLLPYAASFGALRDQILPNAGEVVKEGLISLEMGAWIPSEPLILEIGNADYEELMSGSSPRGLLRRVDKARLAVGLPKRGGGSQ
jgi:hypothetical protein